MNKQTCSNNIKVDIIFLNLKFECLLMLSKALYAHISNQISSVISRNFSYYFLNFIYFFYVCVCYIDAFINVCLDKENK